MPGRSKELEALRRSAAADVAALRDESAGLQVELQSTRHEKSEVTAQRDAGAAEVAALRDESGRLQVELQSVRHEKSEVTVQRDASAAECASLKARGPTVYRHSKTPQK